MTIDDLVIVDENSLLAEAETPFRVFQDDGGVIRVESLDRSWRSGWYPKEHFTVIDEINLEIKVSYSEEDEEYRAIEKNFHASAFGDTPLEALEELQTALDLYLNGRITGNSD